jgi:hypothetical protein
MGKNERERKEREREERMEGRGGVEVIPTDNPPLCFTDFKCGHLLLESETV